MINNAEHSRRDDALGLLLGGPDDAEGMVEARALLLQESAFLDEFESLQRIGTSLAVVGDALHERVGTVDIIDDVFDAISHLAYEEFGVAKASPYGIVERELRDLRKAFDAQAGQVSLVADIMAAVAASRKSDAEVERPFASVAMELNSLGSTLNAHTPEVELVEPVMEKVSHVREPHPAVTPFRARPAVSEARMVSRRRVSWPARLGWAAAACFCAASAWVYLDMQNNGGLDLAGRDLAHNANERSDSSIANGGFTEVLPFNRVEVNPDNGPEIASDDAPKPRIKEPVTLQDAINARRQDLLSKDYDFALLASLTGEEASELLKTMDLSVEALLGAAQFLSTEEAIAVLRNAIAEHPDDPYLKYALALSLEGNPEASEERMQQLVQMAAADSDNSLPQYMLATEHFERGDMAMALDALSKGSSYGNASAYTRESANQREAALVASGLDVDTARFLALSTSGNGEYENIATLRGELMDYGAYYEGLGDYDTAQQIYNAVNQLGEQLYQGADMAVEQQYGLETQYDAISAIQGIAEIMQQPEAIALLGDTLGVLASGIFDVTEYLAARQQLVTNSATSAQLDWTAFLNHVMNNGDLNVSGFVR